MKLEEFNEWVNHLNLSDDAIEEIQIIRSSDPARRVGGGIKNSPGDFPSSKMGVSIQFESSTVELPTAYMLEFDENVLEFYDQPPTLKLRKVGWKTPDYFVIETDKAYWIECKTEEELVKLSQKKNAKYYMDEEKKWRYVPGEEYSDNLGLGFQVISSKEIDWNLQRNLTYLKDYFGSKPPQDDVVTAIKKHIMTSPGITLKALIELEGTEFTIDDINTMIALDIIYVDLYKSLLIEPKGVKVYLSKEQNKSFINLRESAKEKKKTHMVTISNGSKIMWGESQWKILNRDHKTIFLVSDPGEHNSLPIEVFERYIAEGYIIGIEQNSESEADKEAREIMASANEEDYKIANRKSEIVNKFLNGEEIGPIKETDRTIRNWVKDFKDAEELYGNGFLGLLPKKKNRGNSNRKMPNNVLELMQNHIENNFQTIKLKTAKEVYNEFRDQCKNMKLIPPSYQAYCREIRENYSQYDTKKNREGTRAAYEYEEFYWTLEATTPKHGDRAFEIAHIDHTLLDIRIDLGNGQSARPWCTFLVDAFSRKILAFYITFDSPSFTSNMVIVRECVRKYKRLPQTLVVDGGKDFHSVYFDSLLMMFKVTKKSRPAAKARFGSVIERLFGIANKEFIHNLQGNTQAMKNVRQVTKKENPENYAVWPMELFEERLEKWIDDVYHKREHSAHFKSPEKAFNDSIEMTGKRPNTYIPYDEGFIILTLPTPKNRERKVHPGRGVKLNYFHYWNDIFKEPKVEDSMVEVRYDPFNVGVIYVYVNNRWIKCHADLFRFINGKSEKEIKQISEEILEKRKLYEKSRNITGNMIARFIIESEEIEKDLWEEKQTKNQAEVQLELIKGQDKSADDYDKADPESNEFDYFDDDEDLEFYGEG